MSVTAAFDRLCRLAHQEGTLDMITIMELPRLQSSRIPGFLTHSGEVSHHFDLPFHVLCRMQPEPILHIRDFHGVCRSLLEKYDELHIGMRKTTLVMNAFALNMSEFHFRKLCSFNAHLIFTYTDPIEHALATLTHHVNGLWGFPFEQKISPCEALELLHADTNLSRFIRRNSHIDLLNLGIRLHSILPGTRPLLFTPEELKSHRDQTLNLIRDEFIKSWGKLAHFIQIAQLEGQPHLIVSAKRLKELSNDHFLSLTEQSSDDEFYLDVLESPEMGSPSSHRVDNASQLIEREFTSLALSCETSLESFPIELQTAIERAYRTYDQLEILSDKLDIYI